MMSELQFLKWRQKQKIGISDHAIHHVSSWSFKTKPTIIEDKKEPDTANSTIDLISISSLNPDVITANSTNTTSSLTTTSFLLVFKGLFYTFFYSLFLTLASVLVKELAYISPGQLSTVRNAGVLVGSIPVVAYSWEDPIGPKQYRLLLLLRGAVISISIYLNVLSYRMLSIGEATIVLSSLPVFVVVAAKFFLKETCGIIQIIALVLTIIGMLLSVRLPELIMNNGFTLDLNLSYFLGLASAIGSVVLLSANYILVRKMKDVHCSVILLNLGMFGVVVNAIVTACLSSYQWTLCGFDRYGIMMIGVFGFLGHYFFVLAIQIEPAGIVSVIKSSSDIVLAFFFQVYFFRKQPDLYNIASAVLVGLSLILIGIRKWLLTLSATSAVRKKLNLLLL